MCVISTPYKTNEMHDHPRKHNKAFDKSNIPSRETLNKEKNTRNALNLIKTHHVFILFQRLSHV